jgi:hypothetical protein
MPADTLTATGPNDDAPSPFLTWAHAFDGLSEEDFATALVELGDRYAMAPDDVKVPEPEELLASGPRARA